MTANLTFDKFGAMDLTLKKKSVNEQREEFISAKEEMYFTGPHNIISNRLKDTKGHAPCRCFFFHAASTACIQIKVVSEFRQFRSKAGRR